MEHFFSGHYFGMHLFWWIIWIILLFWIFAIPDDIPGQRKKLNSPLDILKKRYAEGEIDSVEYEERKNMLNQ